MSFKDKQALHRTKVRNWTVKNLKADADFMKDCRENEDLRDWVLSERPDMANPKRFKIKFLGIPGNEPAANVEPPVEREPVEQLTKTAQIIKDLKVYRESRGFL